MMEEILRMINQNIKFALEKSEEHLFKFETYANKGRMTNEQLSGYYVGIIEAFNTMYDAIRANENKYNQSKGKTFKKPLIQVDFSHITNWNTLN